MRTNKNIPRKKARHPEVSRCVTVDATLSAVLAGDVAVGVTAPGGLAGNPPPDVVLLADTEVASSADHVGVATPVDHAQVLPLLRWHPRPLLRWRPRPTLLKWRPRP